MEEVSRHETGSAWAKTAIVKGRPMMQYQVRAYSHSGHADGDMEILTIESPVGDGCDAAHVLCAEAPVAAGVCEEIETRNLEGDWTVD